MYRLGLLLLGFTGCVVTPAHQQIALADQSRTSILVEPPNATSPGGLTLYFETDARAHPGDDPTDCPTATDSLTAFVDGTQLALEETGGWDAPVDGTSLCHQIRFSGAFTPDPTMGVISILDSTDTWTITGHSFATFDHLVVKPSPRGELVVESALGQAMTYAEVRVTQGDVLVDGVTVVGAQSQEPLTVTGDTGTMALPTTLTGEVSIAVSGRTTSKPVCNGPASCDLEDPIDGALTATIN